MKRKSALPKNVRLNHGAYFYVFRPIGQKNQRWIKLCSAKDGEIGMYAALTAYKQSEIGLACTMSQLVDKYLLDEFSVKKLKGDDEANKKKLSGAVSQVNRIKATIGENFAADITPKFMKEYLEREFMPSLAKGLTFEQRKKAKEDDQPNSYNKYLSFLRAVFTYAESEDIRPAGSNPMLSISKVDEGRSARGITDSELRRIKQALLRGDDGKRTRIGTMMCLIIDMALLTGQRASDVRRLQRTDVTSEGIQFKPSKTAATTGERILIEWTPKLRAVYEKLLEFQVPHFRYLFTNAKNQPLRAGDLTNAWSRAMKRCTKRGTLPENDRPQFRYLRRKAITEVVHTEGRGLLQGKAMGAHATIEQTEKYVDSPTVFITEKTRATR
jgi:integrase